MVVGKAGEGPMVLEGFTEVTPILRCAVYALVKNGRVVYIGKSIKPLARINAHRRKWIDKRKKVPLADRIQQNIPGLLFDEIHVRPCRQDQLDELEREMIDRYRPPVNKNLKPTGAIQAPVQIKIDGFDIVLNARPQVGQPIRRLCL